MEHDRDHRLHASVEDREAMRAFLQRSEVRLSSIHRAATALLSGAGVLVLLPTLGREALVTVARALMTLERSAASLLLLVAVGGVLAAIVAVVWLLLVELTRFYFHSTALSVAGGTSFSPHLGLPSLRMPTDELSADGAGLLDAGRADADCLEQIVPANGRARRRIDRQLVAHATRSPADGDRARAEALLDLVGAHDHGLPAEVARTEYIMARHTQRLQVIVLRYLKALLVVVVSLVLVLALAAVAAPPSPVGGALAEWTVVLLLLWAPAVMFAVTSPVRWLGALLMSEGASRSGIRYDPEMTRLERVIAALTSGVTLVTALAGLDLARSGRSSATPLLVALAVGVVVHVAMLGLGRRSGRPTRRGSSSRGTSGAPR